LGAVIASGPSYCIHCGSRLEGDGPACERCGAVRWWPPPAAPAAGRVASRGSALGPLPWFYAAGAVLFLVWATQTLAILVSAVGRSQLAAELASQGYPAESRSLLVAAYGVVVLVWLLLAAGLHAAAFYGLRSVRRWGWLAAVLIAGGWSLLLVGVPVLRRLVSRGVRETYGVA
jgi:hypothetical protein